MNPKIEPAMTEISAVLKKHNMAGVFVIGNETHCDWKMVIDPTWSCAWIEELDAQQFAVRVRSKRADYPSSEAQEESVTRTVGMFVTFQHSLTKLNEQLDRVLLMISKSVKFDGKSTEEQ